VGERRVGDSGQVALEAALILPLVIVLGLGILQLAALQQARILTEYAAFQAARAGIVWNGNNERMRDAASMALLPTFGRTDTLAQLASTWVRFRAADVAMQRLLWAIPVPADVNGSPLRGLVRVDTLNPTASVGNIQEARGGADWQELDFDASDYRRATVLTIRVRYWYDMRIPIANGFVFLAWFAAHTPLSLWERVGVRGFGIINRSADSSLLGALGRGTVERVGYDSLYPGEMRVIWTLTNARHFFIPLTATYSMRMQSNFHRKWIMHP
jgi:hypothetical protein